MTTSLHCPVCNSTEVTVFLRIPRAPVFCNQLCHTQQAALDAAVAAIELGFCADCGHIHNTVFEPERVAYSPEYENSLHFSPSFQRYADELAQDLEQRYTLRGKTIAEIGCGRGDFLKSLCQTGRNRGIGFDPGYPGESGVPDPETGVVVYRQPYTETQIDIAPDLLCCRHCLEHIADPRDFLKGLRDTLASRSGTALFFEVPNALFTLRDGGIWDIIYEHCGYFTADSLHRVFTAAGFQVNEVAETYGGQFLTLHARTGHREQADTLSRSRDNLARHAADFGERYREIISGWSDWLRGMQRQGRKVAVWGAGSKGNTFLNLLPSQGVIDHVVDVNPRKQGKFVAGTGQPIVAPESLRDHRPDAIVIMNPLYEQEIRQQAQTLGMNVEWRIA